MKDFISALFKKPLPVTDELTPTPGTNYSTSEAAAIGTKINKCVEMMTQGLVARDYQARMLLLAALAGENTLLFGPPGTGKSLLARRLKDCFAEACDRKQGYFECLLTKFSMPEEVFGPISLKSLEDDKYERVYGRHLPAATVAFIDETFKANSAILNSMLTILNEREFDTGTERVKTQLRTVVGASNELPSENELMALYDRFIVRMVVGRLGDEDLRAMFRQQPWSSIGQTVILAGDRLTKHELDWVLQATRDVEVSDEVDDLLVELRNACAGCTPPIDISERRLSKMRHILKVAAVTSGRAEVALIDTWVLRHCAWHADIQAKWVAEWLNARMDSNPFDLTNILSQIKTEEKQLKKHQEKTATGQHYTESEINNFKASIQRLFEEVVDFREEIASRVAENDAAIQGSPCVPTEYAKVVNHGLLQNQRTAESIHAKLQALLDAYREMPRVEDKP